MLKIELPVLPWLQYISRELALKSGGLGFKSHRVLGFNLIFLSFPNFLHWWRSLKEVYLYFCCESNNNVCLATLPGAKLAQKAQKVEIFKSRPLQPIRHCMQAISMQKSYEQSLVWAAPEREVVVQGAEGVEVGLVQVVVGRRRVESLPRVVESEPDVAGVAEAQ